LNPRQVTLWTAIAAALVSVGVIFHEWRYRVHHPYALGPSNELIALGVVGLLIAIAVIAANRATAQDLGSVELGLLNEYRRHTDLRAELDARFDRLDEDILDGRLLQYLLHESSEELQKWDALNNDARADREIREVEPEEQAEMQLLLARTRVLKLELLNLRLHEVLDVEARQEQPESYDDEDG